MRMTSLYAAAGLMVTGLAGLPTAAGAWHRRVRMFATGVPSVIDVQAQPPSYVSAAVPPRCP
jgi:hypothetical protein